MTIQLTEPTPDLAKRLMSPVAEEKHMVGLKMAAMGGSNPSPLHSLSEVANFIHIGDYEMAMQDRQATVGYLDPVALARWVEEVLEDEELADAIRQTASQGEFYGAVAMPIKELLIERLEQSDRVLHPVEPATDELTPPVPREPLGA